MRHKLVFWMGLLGVLVYWFSVKPAGFQRGYLEDHCTFEMSRQAMADQIREKGGPAFFTKHYMYPEGTSTAYLPQSIEQTWIGAQFWNWNRDFPYHWVYFGVSLLITYVGVGVILRKMKINSLPAWGLSALVTLFHLPRHYAIWYHSEHLYLHWIYLGFFLDALIWQKFYRENQLSIPLELWRGFCLLGVFGTCGYFWGPSLVEWIIVRTCLFGWIVVQKRHAPVRMESSFRALLLPATLSVVLFAIELRWFVPLLKEASKLGTVPQGLIYHAPIFMVIRPLWWDWIMRGVEQWVPFLKGLWLPFQFPETKVTIGWAFWIPTLLGIRAVKKNPNSSLGVLFPFLILLGVAIWYLGIKPHWVQNILQATIPFMKFFRVASRWGLFLPQIVGLILVLSWPELTQWFQNQMRKQPQKWKMLGCLFLASSLVEMSWMTIPVNRMEPFTSSNLEFLETIRHLPGSAVLDMPFCVLAGNEVCAHQCPFFPYATAGSCFRQWHDKDVYGIYESRLVPNQCANYDQQPYQSWFSAWGNQRCYSDEEWKSLCSYLDQHSELSAILVYPDVWKGVNSLECQKKFEFYLGSPLDQTQVSTDWLPHEKKGQAMRVVRYAPHCRR